MKTNNFMQILLYVAIFISNLYLTEAIIEFENQIRLLVSTKETVDVLYKLYEKDPKSFYAESFSKICDKKLKPNIKLLVHGYAYRGKLVTNDKIYKWQRMARDEFLKNKESDKLCVIMVDWNILASGGIIPNYLKAKFNIRSASKMLIKFFEENKLQDYSFHCIGFSLGAHFCGTTGEKFIKVFKKKIDRISGLDPAGPLFDYSKTINKLDDSDAKFVDVIHTSTILGYYKPIGHIYFFPHDIDGDYEDRLINTIKSEAANFVKLLKKLDFEHLKNGVLDSKQENVIKQLLNETKIDLHDEDDDNDIDAHFDIKLPSIKMSRLVNAKHKHYLAVKHYILSLNQCSYEINSCDPSVNTSEQKECDLVNKEKKSSRKPRMGYYADKVNEMFKKTHPSFHFKPENCSIDFIRSPDIEE